TPACSSRGSTAPPAPDRHCEAGTGHAYDRKNRRLHLRNQGTRNKRAHAIRGGRVLSPVTTSVAAPPDGIGSEYSAHAGRYAAHVGERIAHAGELFAHEAGGLGSPMGLSAG